MTTIDRIETFRRGSDVSLVRVETADGDVGWGQTAAYVADYSTAYLHEFLAPAFLGTNPWAYRSVADNIGRQLYKIAGTIFYRALCGLDTAILDLLARRAGVPAYAFLGGPARQEIPVYGSSMRRDISPEAEVDRLVQLRERDGFGAFKVRIGSPMGRDRDERPGRTEKLIELSRATLGSEVALMADANGAYTAARAIEVGRLLEGQGFWHFEEPCPYEEIEQTAEVSAALDIRVSGGEQDNSLPQFRRLIFGDVVDVVQPDVGYIGGVSRALEVAAMASARGIPFTPHVANHSLLQVFTAHLVAAVPGASQFMEWSIEDAAWTADLYSGEPVVRNGSIQLPDAPGWGIEVDQQALESMERRESLLRSQH